MRHLIDILDLTTQEIDSLICVASDIVSNPEKYREKCRYQKLATLFYEPSTRTRLSFEAAMMELGGNVLGFSEPSSSSAAKGESISDTAAIVSSYADIIAMRHPKEGAPLVAARKSEVPIINAGDGGHHHPTQTLTDLFTIHREKGSLENLTIGVCGDLKHGRTVHSLIAAMSRYKGIKFVLISPPELKLPGYIKYNYIEPNKIEYIETDSLEKAIPALDVLYMTRIQRERFSSAEEYEKLKDSYILSAEKLNSAKSDMIVMHPLPRVNEIAIDVDEDRRAAYFRQAKNGKYIRMALILKLLEEAKNDNAPHKEEKGVIYTKEYKCINRSCISTTEQELVSAFKLVDKENKIYRCVYCDSKAVINKDN